MKKFLAPKNCRNSRQIDKYAIKEYADKYANK